MNDSDLVAGLRRQDPAAVRHLSDCLLPSVWRFVYFRVKGDQHLAEDIVSDSVLALVKAIAAPDGNVQCPSAWLRTVATHKIQDHFRAAARVQHLIDQVTTKQADGSPEPLQQQELDEQRATIRRVMDDLPEDYRLVLEWKYVDRISVREIAARMSATEKTAEATLYRARKEFREAFGRLDRDGRPFRVNGHEKTPVTADRQTSDGKETACPVNDVCMGFESGQTIGLDEVKQHQP